MRLGKRIFKNTRTVIFFRKHSLYLKFFHFILSFLSYNKNIKNIFERNDFIMKSKTVLVLMSIFLVLTFTSGFAAKSKVSKGTSVNNSMNTNKLLHTSWKLKSVSGKALKKVVIEGREENVMITLNFSSDVINGSGGVNNYTAGYKIKGNNISLTQISSTLRAGFTELMKAEQNYFQILQNVKTFELKGDILTLKSDNGSLVFSKMPN